MKAENCALRDVAAMSKAGGVTISKAEVLPRQFGSFNAFGAATAMARPLQSATETVSYMTLAPTFEPIKETRRVDHPRDARSSSAIASPARPPGLGQAPSGGSGGEPRREFSNHAEAPADTKLGKARGFGKAPPGGGGDSSDDSSDQEARRREERSRRKAAERAAKISGEPLKGKARDI